MFAGAPHITSHPHTMFRSRKQVVISGSFFPQLPPYQQAKTVFKNPTADLTLLAKEGL